MILELEQSLGMPWNPPKPSSVSAGRNPVRVALIVNYSVRIDYKIVTVVASFIEFSVDLIEVLM